MLTSRGMTPSSATLAFRLLRTLGTLRLLWGEEARLGLAAAGEILRAGPAEIAPVVAMLGRDGWIVEFDETGEMALSTAGWESFSPSSRAAAVEFPQANCH